MVTSLVLPADIGGIILGDTVKENNALVSRIVTSVSASLLLSSDTSITLYPGTIFALFGISTVPDQPPLLSKVGVPLGVIVICPEVPKISTSTSSLPVKPDAVTVTVSPSINDGGFT